MLETDANPSLMKFEMKLACDSQRVCSSKAGTDSFLDVCWFLNVRSLLEVEDSGSLAEMSSRLSCKV